MTLQFELKHQRVNASELHWHALAFQRRNSSANSPFAACSETQERITAAGYELDLSYLLRMEVPGGPLTEDSLPQALRDNCTLAAYVVPDVAGDDDAAAAAAALDEHAMYPDAAAMEAV